jgi:hypothetical protein
MSKESCFMLCIASLLRNPINDNANGQSHECRIKHLQRYFFVPGTSSSLSENARLSSTWLKQSLDNESRTRSRCVICARKPSQEHQVHADGDWRQCAPYQPSNQI